MQLKTDRFIAAVLKESSRGDEGRTIRGASGGWFDHRGEFFWLTSSQISLPDRGVTDRQVIPLHEVQGGNPMCAVRRVLLILTAFLFALIACGAPPAVADSPQRTAG